MVQQSATLEEPPKLASDFRSPYAELGLRQSEYTTNEQSVNACVTYSEFKEPLESRHKLSPLDAQSRICSRQLVVKFEQ